jgi:hypothetical protein
MSESQVPIQSIRKMTVIAMILQIIVRFTVLSRIDDEFPSLIPDHHR